MWMVSIQLHASLRLTQYKIPPIFHTTSATEWNYVLSVSDLDLDSRTLMVLTNACHIDISPSGFKHQRSASSDQWSEQEGNPVSFFLFWMGAQTSWREMVSMTTIPSPSLYFFISRGGVLHSACVVLYTITRLWIRCESAVLILARCPFRWLVG